MIHYFVEGSDELDFEELQQFEGIQKKCTDLMKAHGYRQVLSPPFEEYEMYTQVGNFSRKKMLKMIDADGRVLVLRPDATLPITRMAAYHFPDGDRILKFCYACTIFREHSDKTHYRKHFTQAGVEYFGNPTAECDAEVIALALKILEDLSLSNTRVDIGHAGFTDALIRSVGFTESERKLVKSLVEGKNISDLHQFIETKNVEDRVAASFYRIPQLFGSYEETMKQARDLIINEEMALALSNLDRIYRALCSFDLQSKVRLDLGFTNDLQYYSGAIFKVYNDQTWENIASGGRYDLLSAKFRVDRPACGFGINLNLVSEILKSKKENTPFDVLIRYTAPLSRELVETCDELRRDGLSIDCVAENHYVDPCDYRRILFWTGRQLAENRSGKLVEIQRSELTEFSEDVL